MPRETQTLLLQSPDSLRRTWSALVFVANAAVLFLEAWCIIICLASPNPRSTPATEFSMRLSRKIKQHPLYWTIKLFLKRISGQELWLRPELKLDTSSSGDWHFCQSLLGPHAIVYSLGVGDSVEFDLDLIKRCHVNVCAFDPTPDSVSWVNNQQLPDQFKFYQWAVSGTNGKLKMVKRVSKRGKKSKMIWTMLQGDENDIDSIEVPSFTIPSIMEKLNHGHIDLLKMDVEGAEYDIADTLINLPNKPKQLLVEFHHRFPGIGKNKTADCIRKLRKAGYKIFSVSETGREIGFILSN